MIRKNLVLLLPLFFIFACKTDPEKDQTIVHENAVRYFVNIDNTPIRTAPSLQGNVIAKLDKGSSVYHNGEVGPEFSVMVLDSQIFCEPWLKVKLDESQDGWVFGGALNYKGEVTAYLQARSKGLLGAVLNDSLEHFAMEFSNLENQEALEALYQRAKDLQSRINNRLEQVSYDLAGPMGLPDLFWLDKVTPGFVPQVVAEGTSYYLFLDYRQWLAKAIQTKGNGDEAFMFICTRVFPSDSIEYFFPAWTIQTWDYGGHSLLGRGIHVDLLAEMDGYYTKWPFFRQDIENFRMRLIDDMTRAEVTYWESKEKILAELDSILSLNLDFLTETDLVGMTVRRDQFVEFERFEIQLNQRSGE